METEGRFFGLEGKLLEAEGRFFELEGRFLETEDRFFELEGRFFKTEVRFSGNNNLCVYGPSRRLLSGCPGPARSSVVPLESSV